MPKVGGGYEMHITFAYEPNAPDLKYILQRNQDLGTFFARWTLNTATGIENIHPSGTVTSTLDPIAKTVTIVDAGIGNDTYFWRLKVEFLP